MKKIALFILLSSFGIFGLTACKNTKEEGQIMACEAVNIEGIIVEVSEDGNRFKLDNGKIVQITPDTLFGINSLNAAPRSEQYFKDTFEVGNSIAGFTENLESDVLTAYAIYTNWNFEKHSLNK